MLGEASHANGARRPACRPDEPMIRKSSRALRTGFTLLFLQLPSLSLAEGPQDIAQLLVEARSVAASIQDEAAKAEALEAIVWSQIHRDPRGAQESLRLFPALMNHWRQLESLAGAYGRAGHVQGAHDVYLEVKKGDATDRQARLVMANVLGHVAIAQANAGALTDALATLSQLKEEFQGQSLANFEMATRMVALAQANHGDLEGALHTALAQKSEVTQTTRAMAAQRIRAGDPSRAHAIVNQVEEPLQPIARLGIVEAQSEQGRLEEAAVTAAMIKPGHAKSLALLAIGNYSLKKGDRAQAVKALREAADSGKTIVNNWARADTLWLIAAAMAEAGDSSQALASAQMIEEDFLRRAAVRDIAIAEARQGKVQQALKTALPLREVSEADEDRSRYVQTISDLLREAARFGHAKDTLDNIPGLRDLTAYHPSFFYIVAAAQAEQGDLTGALTALSNIGTDAQRKSRRNELRRALEVLPRKTAEDWHQRGLLHREAFENAHALAAIAGAYARQGSMEQAQAIASDLYPHDRNNLFKECGRILAETESGEKAIRWARTLEAPVEKAYALVGIADALSQDNTARHVKP